MFIMTLGPIETPDSLVLEGAGIDVACNKKTNLMKKSLFLKLFMHWVVDTLQNAARVKIEVWTVIMLYTYKMELLK